MAYNLSVINEDWVFPNSNFNYAKSSAFVDITEDFPIESKNYKKSNPTANVYVQFSYTSDQSQVIEFIDTFNFTDNFSIEKLYAFGSLLKLKFKNINAKSVGNLNFTLTITVKNKIDASTYETIETINIPGKVVISNNAGSVSHNLQTVNFANDQLQITGTSSVSYLMQLSAEIVYQGVTKEVQLEDVFIKNTAKSDLKGVFQPYIYLSDAQISEFFENYKLNIEPAQITISGKFLNEKFEVLQEFSVGTFSFYAGKKANLFNNGDVINRSLNYNTFLTLPYEYQTQDITLEFQGSTKTINKQSLSAPGKILQLLFSQRSHDFKKDKSPSFSLGFNNGFATENALENVKSFHLYKEGYVNEISSYYTVKGYNFPWQKHGFNIVWLDENNIFRSLPLTGEMSGEKQIKNYLNENAVNPKNYKAGNTIKDVRKVNTGFILDSETELVINLQKSKHAWFFADDPSQRIFCVAVNAKVSDVDTNRELIQYDLDLEFYE